MDLSQEVGKIELTYTPSDDSSSVSKDTNFGDMKIEFFSDSTLKDIKVTFASNEQSQSGNAVYLTD